MKLVATNNLSDYAEYFRLYQEASSKTPERVLTHRAGRMAMRLWDLFRAERPDVSEVATAAKTREFRFRRRPNALTPVNGNLSSASVRRAQMLMEGRRSQYFRVTEGEGGVPIVRRARVGVRNSSKLLVGGRFGNRFAATARAVTALTRGQRIALVANNPDLRLLNIQALATAIEMGYRARAAKGGLLALQFLHQVYARRKSSTVKNGPLVSRTRKGDPIGRVDFRRDGKGNVSEVVIVGSVPGTAKVNAERGIVSQAVTAEALDMKEYLRTKVSEDLKRAGLKK